MSSRWVPAADRADPPIRLFCFPHAGGGARSFLPWRAALGPHIGVCPVVLPGREHRMREEPFTRLGPLVAEIVAALRPYLDGPFAFFGHSLGALVAYEVARGLAAAGLPEPGVLLASGRRAPHLEPRASALHLLPHEQFVAHMLELGGTPAATARRRRAVETFVPTVRADYELNETYEPPARPPLTCPVTAYHGRDDPVATVAQVDGWRETSTGPFRLRLFPGGHFYHRDAPDAVVAAVHDDCEEISCGTPPGHLRVGHGRPSGQDR